MNEERPKEIELVPVPGGIAYLDKAKTDVEKAAAYRAELRPLLEKVVAVLQRARNEGMNISWAMGPDQYGRMQVPNIDVTRPL